MEKLKYLNLGCGKNYVSTEEWINIDFVSIGKDVISHNLLKGIPFEDNTFDLIYHSHVLEHFSKNDGINFIAECYRVLKPGGIIRVVIPDLEKITREYIKSLEICINEPKNTGAVANYQWMLLEMYDQTVRNKSGGLMREYLSQKKMINENFVSGRIGEQVQAYRKNISIISNNKPRISSFYNFKKIAYKLFRQLKSSNLFFLLINNKAYNIGKFRLEGEIHQWMYDRFSLGHLLSSCGFYGIEIRDAFTSYINNWENYGLDGKNNIIRKPDSLFMEAVK